MKRKNIKKWLKENNYYDILNKINKVEQIWIDKGKKTRRNWWEVLAGNINGRRKVIEGVEFPVLKAAQIREGRVIEDNALYNKKDEIIPEKWYTNRWPKDKKEEV